MIQKLTILGIDPALRNTGLSIAEYDLTTGRLQVKALQLIETEKSKDGKAVRKSSDDLARATLIVQGIARAVTVYRPMVAVAEVPTGTQSARGAFSNGVCCGVLASVPVPLIEVSPTEVKMAAVGIKTATKDQMITWAIGQWPEAGWLTYKRLGKVEFNDKNEHLADACAAVSAGILTPAFASAVAMFRSARAMAA